MIGEGDAAFDKARAFGFEQAALEAGKRLADGDPAAGGDDAMPGNGLTAWTSGHGPAGGASSAGKPSGARDLAIGKHAAFGDALHQHIDLVPVARHVEKITRKGVRRQV